MVTYSQIIYVTFVLLVNTKCIKTDNDPSTNTNSVLKFINETSSQDSMLPDVNITKDDILTLNITEVKPPDLHLNLTETTIASFINVTADVETSIISPNNMTDKIELSFSTVTNATEQIETDITSITNTTENIRIEIWPIINAPKKVETNYTTTINVSGIIETDIISTINTTEIIEVAIRSIINATDNVDSDFASTEKIKTDITPATTNISENIEIQILPIIINATEKFETDLLFTTGVTKYIERSLTPILTATEELETNMTLIINSTKNVLSEIIRTESTLNLEVIPTSPTTISGEKTSILSPPMLYTTKGSRISNKDPHFGFKTFRNHTNEKPGIKLNPIVAYVLICMFLLILLASVGVAYYVYRLFVYSGSYDVNEFDSDIEEAKEAKEADSKL